MDRQDLTACTKLIHGVLNPIELPEPRVELPQPPEEILSAVCAKPSTGGLACSVSTGRDDEIYIGDVVSVSASSRATQEPVIEHVMKERIKALEKEVAQKQHDVMLQMRLLQQKNEHLECDILDERHSTPLAPRYDHTLAATPLRSSMRREAFRQSRSTCRYSLMSLDGTRRRALIEASVPAQPTRGEQRKWWAEQRAFLLKICSRCRAAPLHCRSCRPCSELIHA